VSQSFIAAGSRAIRSFHLPLIRSLEDKRHKRVSFKPDKGVRRVELEREFV
jgi:hypothetical protein